MQWERRLTDQWEALKERNLLRACEYKIKARREWKTQKIHTVSNPPRFFCFLNVGNLHYTSRTYIPLRFTLTSLFAAPSTILRKPPQDRPVVWIFWAWTESIFPYITLFYFVSNWWLPAYEHTDAVVEYLSVMQLPRYVVISAVASNSRDTSRGDRDKQEHSNTIYFQNLQHFFVDLKHTRVIIQWYNE